MSIKDIAKKVSELSASEAASFMKASLQKDGPDHVQKVLNVLQDYDRNRHGQDDSWWLQMMHDAGEEVSKLF